MFGRATSDRVYYALSLGSGDGGKEADISSPIVVGPTSCDCVNAATSTDFPSHMRSTSSSCQAQI